MRYRILWAWDSWVCDPCDVASYTSEFKALIDFMAEWGYNGLVIWGFIDDRHGGEAAAKEVASYGREKGVRVMPGVGAGGYGGFVTSRPHRFNIETFLEKRPDLAAERRDGPDWGQGWLCLYQQDTLDWLREGAAWLAENFDIGGVNIETNEANTIDNCELAAQATRDEPNRLKYSASFSDLSIAVPIIRDEVKKRHPDSWVTYATYQPPWWDRKEDLWLLDRMPHDAIAQWNMEMNVDPDEPPPVKENVSLIHSGGWSYHVAAFPSRWTFTQYRCFYPTLEEARQFARNQAAMKMDGFVLGNVGSHKMPDNEINYIAHIEFSRDPEMTIDRFSAEFISRLYGERAEPLVRKLMLNQTAAHQAVVWVWKKWTRLMLGEKVDKLDVASQSDIEALSNQLALARNAWELASSEGRQRLDTMIQILSEYHAIARMSADPRLARLVTDYPNLDPSALADGLRIVADIAREEGLPGEVYGYSRHL